MEIIMECKQCKDRPKPNKEKSNENWESYDTTCSMCGGEISMIFEDKKVKK